jgi:hypothetical protein
VLLPRVRNSYTQSIIAVDQPSGKADDRRRFSVIFYSSAISFSRSCPHTSRFEWALLRCEVSVAYSVAPGIQPGITVVKSHLLGDFTRCAGFNRRQLLPVKCPFKTEIGAFWQFQPRLLPSCEGKPFELGNLRSIR